MDPRLLRKAIETGRHTYEESVVRSCSLLFHKLRRDEAEAAIAEMLETRPEDGAEADYQKARFLERFRSDKRAALDRVSRSLAAKPHWRAFLFRAYLQRRLGSRDEADRDLRSCLELNPSAWEAYLERTRLRREEADAEGAAADLELALFEKHRDAAHRSGDEVYFRLSTAVAVPTFCEDNDFAILGFEGFLLEDGRLAPQLDSIADFSSKEIGDWDEYRGSCNASAKRVLESWSERPELLVHFVFDVRPPAQEID